ncbi:hypothetical protein BXY85_1976 [Roseivirga pacifica]|uniref:Uncharacterized protein n=1 Tax=Roseivirga pacifica TaxID=1267423 RepID=A0A1I0N6D7_9BACT|nr:hypothetical protein [Roseivirga pacifica]RKQ50955.1 hypothetical protein BXY85_1976 [Roseivirga pacifica]SEV96592.1 hypothetical protein SAMN05216290_0958 [Roseivirga pacifica]
MTEGTLKLEVDWYTHLFAIYWFLLLFSTTQILGRVGLLLPVLFGLLVFLKYAKVILNAQVVMVYLLLAIAAFWISAAYRRTGEDIIAALTSSLLIFSNLGVAFLVAQFDGKKLYRVVLAFNIFMVSYIVVMRLAGFIVLDAIQIIFQSSSYHLLAWLLFILNTLVLLPLAHSIEKKKILRLSFTFLLAMVSLQGRSGIVMGFLILFYVCWVYYRKYFALTVFLGLVFGVSGVVSFDPESLSFISDDLYSRGAKLGPREALYGCYYLHIGWSEFLFGFNKAGLVGDCIAPIDPKSVGRTESSILSLISESGLIAVLLLGILIKHMIRGFKGNKMFLVMVGALLFRVISADFLFSTVFDWFIYFLAFSYTFAPHKKVPQNSEAISYL